jgi:hypothetical protein
MNNAIEQDMDTFSSQEALDNERAYYKVRFFLLSIRWVTLQLTLFRTR